ncbi:phosphate signaling complex protein PhoU [Thauera butanivorans]|jgi:phosphate transport system protein|uniref:phosphate signaling complex protein PhoU n=1 Tax=Thauera butanivorans TaxID=86174 RepID=UPI00083872C8|nr:phosphate signaling complex protein PhoU [Thauera butanivorans]
MTEHTYKQFSTELEEIRSGVLRMGGLVEAQAADALEGLRTGNLSLLNQVIEGDQRINLMQKQLDDACNHIVALRQPTAADMRLVMTVIRSVADLERIGDEAKKIAKSAKRLHSAELSFAPRIDLSPSARAALAMLHSALDAFARADASAAPRIEREDAEVDASFKAIMRQLITYMMEDPRTITSSLELLFNAKAIERIGDHAMNIAEYVVFLAQGEDVRYSKSEEAQRSGN